MRALPILIAALALLCGAPGARAMTLTQIGQAYCNTAASSCAIPLTTSVAAGSNIIVVGTNNLYSSSVTITVADNAATPNCGGAYAVKFAAVNSPAYNTQIRAICQNTATALTTSNTITVTTSSGTALWNVVAYTATNASTVKVLAASGTAVSGSFTSGTALPTEPTVPMLTWSSEDALAMVTWSGHTADTVAWANGFSAVGCFAASASNRPAVCIGKYAGIPTSITSPTVTITGTAAGYVAAVDTYVNASTTRIGCGGCGGLLGILR